MRLLTQLTSIANGHTRTISCQRVGHALLKRVVGVLVLIIMARIGLRHLCITIPIRLLRIVTRMAIMVIVHVGVHVSLVMVEVERFRALVITGPVVVVIRRNPNCVVRPSVNIPHRRAFDKHRSYHIIVAIQIAVTDNLDVQSVRTPLGYQCCHVLEDARRQTILYQECMVITLPNLYNTQIINVSVTIEVQVINHVTA